jgi:hypothetical protein
MADRNAVKFPGGRRVWLLCADVGLDLSLLFDGDQSAGACAMYPFSMRLWAACVRTLVPLLVAAFFAAALGGADAMSLPAADSHSAASHVHVQDPEGSPCAPEQDTRHHDHACVSGGTCLPGTMPSAAPIPLKPALAARAGFVQIPQSGTRPFPEHRPPEHAA